MFSNLLSSVGGGVGATLSDRISARLFGPAIVFWLGGLGALVAFYGWTTITTILLTADIVHQFLGLVGVLTLLMVSEIAIDWFTFPLLQLVEGYHWPEFLRKQQVAELQQKFILKRNEWKVLTGRGVANLSVVEKARHAALDHELSLYPDKAINGDLMPTQVGNVLKAAEQYSYYHYGLEAITVWPRLWVLLPEPIKQELSIARLNLERAVQLIAWGILFWGWALFALWAIPLLLVLPIGFLIMIVGYYRAIQMAKIYGNLIRTAFDLHRFDLYRAMKWPLPENTDTEVKHGRELTAYIFRGLVDNTTIQFEH